MRVSSLSDKRVIDLLTRYFVPVYAARDESRDLRPSKEEHAELQRIGRATTQRGFEAGSVCVYIVHPDGSALGSQMVQKASKPDLLIPFLKQLIEKEKVPPRDPGPARAAAPPRTVKPKTDGGLVLHVWTRFEGNRADYGLSQDWVELTPAEWTAFMPEATAKTGTSWKVPQRTAEKIFHYFYPPGPNWDHRDSKLVAGGLTATVAARSAKEVQVYLRGTVESSYPFAGKDTDGTVTAKLVGVLRCDLEKKTLTSFALVAEEARYVWQWQGKPQPEKMAIAVELE